ncbi:hypothetical protein IUQ79_14505 [Mycobacteroides abscessus subsp. bolletii]|uniref:hypothetical protein n=1 Tax=Mycobacteroides abscessus TaxID=36809 RepID=UPI0019D17B1C|nr:hypothetical protein [Mycobacteroides abscessus]MBN7303114.1 hypothetical protein [Mycobacteroides abscessus subsp. bolletii]
MTSERLEGHGQSLALHALVVAKLLRNPDRVSEIAQRNVEDDLEIGDVHSEKYTREWDRLLKQNIPSLIDTMLDPSDHGITMRSCTPFTGILTDDEVQAVKRAVPMTSISGMWVGGQPPRHGGVLIHRPGGHSNGILDLRPH